MPTMPMLRTFAAVSVLAGCAPAPLERFPSSPVEGISGSRTSLEVPPGPGPHPAVVLMPTCGGIGRAFQHWTSALRLAGYAVLAVDSLGPRGQTNVCGSLAVSVDDMAVDALAAGAHLRKLPFVDRDRVYGMGFSYGGMALLRTASAAYLARQRHPVPFRAIAAFYPHCQPRPGAGPAAAQAQLNLFGDVATPVHLLLGGADAESPADLCTGRADDLRRERRPVSYTVFEGATHGFDMPSSAAGYRYDPDAVARSEREVLDFFSRAAR